MVAIKTQIGAHDRATDVPYDPPAGLIATNVWDAIKKVWDLVQTFSASISSLTASVTGLIAPQYLVAASDGTLANERVATNTGTITWDFSSAGVASANVPNGGIGTAQLADALLTFAKLSAATFSTDGTLAGNSDTTLPTQKAVKTYVDALATAISGGLLFKGSFDASAGTFPGGGTAKIGYFYKVSVAGTVNGQAFDIGDDIYAIANNASTSTYAANWLIIQGVLSSAEIVAALASASLAYAKIQNVSATSRLLGRVSAGAGVIEEIVLDTDGTLSSNSDIRSPSQKAVKTYMDSATTARNRVRNPLGRWTQAGLASTADAAYTGFDEWYALNESNPVTPSQLTAVDNVTQFMMRITQANASAQRFGIAQPFEAFVIDDLRGQTLSFRARMRCSASVTVNFALVEWQGTVDAITRDIVNTWSSGTLTPGNFFIATTTAVVGTGSVALTANTLTDVIADAIGTVSASMNNLILIVWIPAQQAQNVTLDLGNVWVGRAPHAPSVFVPPDPALDLLLCQRRGRGFDSSLGSFAPYPGAGSCDSTTAASINVPLDPPMAGNPSLVVTSPTLFAIKAGAAFVATTGITVNAPSPGAVQLSCAVASGLGAGNGALLQANSSTATRLFLSTRL